MHIAVLIFWDLTVDYKLKTIHAVLPPISLAAAIRKLAHICHGKNGKSGKAKTLKKELFWGAFPKNKMYLVIKFSTRPYIQLEMGLKPANFVPIPS